MQGFVTYKQALFLAALGYDIPAFARYYDKEFVMNTTSGPVDYNSGTFSKSISAPLNSQAISWFRETQGFDCSFDVLEVTFTEEEGIVTEVERFNNQYQIYRIAWVGKKSHGLDGSGYDIFKNKGEFDTMVEAEEHCITTVLEKLIHEQAEMEPDNQKKVRAEITELINDLIFNKDDKQKSEEVSVL